MSRAAWFNCCAGVAGDMLLASLVDAGADRLSVMEAWAALDVGDDYAATWERVQRCGVGAQWTNIVVHDHEQHDHQQHDHEQHDGDHGGLHRPARDVLELIARADLPDRVRRDATAVYTRLATVEGEIHGVPADEVELHEVGALDSILDVVGVCAALADLAIDDVSYSPIAVGHGTVDTSHGRLPNPVPAVARLLADAAAPTVGIDTTMELATPTGVALLTTLGRPSAPMPSMTVAAAGFGAGTADPPGRPNVVQVVVGTTVAPTDRDTTGRPCHLLEANVDDVTGEVLAHTVETALAAGAFDAWITPIVMKKGRPAHTVAALCDDATFDAVRRVLVDETGTLGIRAMPVRRWPQHRTEVVVDVGGHAVRVKVGETRCKVEFDDALVAATALGRPVRWVLGRAEQLAGESA